MVGIMQNVGVLAASLLASRLTDNMLLLFMIPAAIGVVGMVVYAVVLPDPVLDTKPPRLTLSDVAQTF